MDRTELLNEINAGRARLEAALTRLTPEQMTRPDLPGEWSVKDLLAHLGWWQRREVMIYHALKEGVRPETVLVSGTIDELNARVLADYRARDLEEVRAFEHQAYLDLLAIAETAPEEELFGHHTFAWTGGQPFVDWIAGDTYDHYAEHLPAVEVLLAEQEPALREPALEPGESSLDAAELGAPRENPIVTRARAFLEEHGRYIDQVRFDYHFGTQSLEEVMDALSRYMNEDGGFHGLEVDIQAPQSNPFADELALVVLRWVDALPGAAAPAAVPAVQEEPSENLPASEESLVSEGPELTDVQSTERLSIAKEEPASEELIAAEEQPAVEELPAAEEVPSAEEQAGVELPVGGAVNPQGDNTVRAQPLLQRLVAHLETSQQEDGTWRFSPEIYQSALAPWFQGWQWPNLSPSCSIAGLLKQLGAGSDELHARVQALFDEISAPGDLCGADFYAARPYAYYFQTEWDYPLAEFYRQGVVWWLVRKLVTDPTFDATHFFEFAPTPDSAVAKRLPPDLIEDMLNQLLEEQQPDGGWPTPYDERWRPWNTVNNMLVLRAYGRI